MKLRRVAYLTLGESYGSVYKSQVIDRIAHLQKEQKATHFCILAILPCGTFFKDRKRLKKDHGSVVCLPSYPRTKNWDKNYIVCLLLLMFGRFNAVVCRGPFAAALAIRCRKRMKNLKVVYDGRGARAAEILEYSPSHPLKDSVSDIESSAVNDSDYQLAVSQKLVDYWSVEYGYQKNLKHYQVVPCNVTSVFETPVRSRKERRHELGWNDDDIVFVFSGGISQWQLSTLFQRFCEYVLKRGFRLLILAKGAPIFDEWKTAYEGSVRQMWIPSDTVPSWISAGDYGVMLRDQNVTNSVAAPVKFAEYLCCGLKVICSENLGDYSEFVTAFEVGHVIGSSSDFSDIEYKTISEFEIETIRNIALMHFSKKNDRTYRAHQAMFDAIGI